MNRMTVDISLDSGVPRVLFTLNDHETAKWMEVSIIGSTDALRKLGQALIAKADEREQQLAATQGS